MKQESKINVLVTGCGGDIGASIAKICKSSNLFGKVIGCNNNDRHFSKYLYDRHYIVENFSSGKYKLQINDILLKENIDLIVPASEIELRMILKHGLSSDYFIKPYLCANLKSLDIGFDKLKTVNFLKDIGVPYPKTGIFSEVANTQEYPFIIKSRDGYGSKSVILVNNDAEKSFYLDKHPHYIAQEYLDADDAEYTCGLFNSKDGSNLRIIVFHRNLYDGTTSYGQLVEIPEIDTILAKIAKNIGLVGSINVQLRITSTGPVVFEINPRFSSTVRFRHLMKYEDFIWSVQDLFKIPISDYGKPPNGIKFYRVSDEIIDQGKSPATPEWNHDAT